MRMDRGGTLVTMTLLAMLLVGSIGAGSARAAGAPHAKPVQAAEPSALERAALEKIGGAEIAAHVRFLSDDLLEGRKPGTKGSELAVKYIAAQLEAMGLEPGAPPAQPGAARSFLQPVPLVELKAQVPASLQFTPLAGGQPVSLSASGGTAAELVIDPDAHVELARLKDAELVFAGYGIVAPEYGWDDYKGSDVRGKVVVLLNFNPPFAGEANGKKVRLWYGRWDYKYLTAAAHGAIAALVIHTQDTAGYPWQVLSASADGARIDLPPEGEPRMQFQGWVSEPGAKRLFAAGGKDLAALTQAATGPEAKAFRPTALGTRLSLEVPIARRSFQSANVIALLPGTDPALRDEGVLYTAHHDHLGSVQPIPPATDGIYNGALDNASGVATVLAIARASRLAPPRRSLFFCLVTAEEQGLLGSRYLARHPPLPAGRLAAGINIDSVNIWGRTRDLGMLGLGKSSLDQLVGEVAREQGRSIHGDPFPDRGAFYRSDQFELARIGVPVAALKGGPDYEGRPPGWGAAQHQDYEDHHYHQVSDEFHDQWNLEGAIQDARLQLLLGLRIGNAAQLPQWKAGDEFESARKRAAR